VEFDDGLADAFLKEDLKECRTSSWTEAGLRRLKGEIELSIGPSCRAVYFIRSMTGSTRTRDRGSLSLAETVES
jgi:hypothetical protein